MNLPVLAVWFRELGKFAQRAGSCAPLSSAGAPGSAEDCAAFFINNTLPLPRDMEDKRSILADLASAQAAGEHGSQESAAIARALNLASGMNAPDTGEAQDSNPRLASIFSKLRLGGRGLDAKNATATYRLLPLDNKEAIFPVQDAPKDYDYTSLWRQFCAALKDLPQNLGQKAWQASLVSLLERYCWCVPSGSSPSSAAISLFDQAAAAAAICQAILACPEGGENFLLFGGDLSGIQSFIFGREQEGDKGAVRLLRARSFLLQALTRSIWLCLLDRLGLEHCAKIMDAGGRFILLLPDLPEIHNQLDWLEKEAGRWLLDNFQGSLRMNFARLALQSADLDRKNFSASFDRFNDLLEQAKLHPFSHALRDGLLPLPPLVSSYANGECASCHARPASPDSEEGDCLLCATLKRMGRELPSTEFIVFSRHGKEGRLNFNNILFDGLDLHFYEKEPSPQEAENALEILSVKGRPIFTLSPIAGHVPEITRKDIENWEDWGLLQKKDGENLFMGEECRVGNQKNFAMLAQAARIPPQGPGQPWRSIAALGICKADVDNLGLIFSMGFGADFSLSRFAMLARMLNHFFSGWLMRLIQEEYPNLYVVFAGGDDVFVIGPWSESIAFALRMAEEFKKFSGANPAVSISCGLPVVKPGLPMRGIREEAEAALEESKHYVSEDENTHKKYPKNALTLFSQSAHWDEAKKLLDTGHWLAQLCDANVISQGFVRRLLGYSRECANFLKGKKLMENGKYISKLQRDLAKNALYKPHLDYDLARNWKPMSEKAADRPAASAVDKDLLKIKEMAQNKNLFSRSEMGISWALYRTRTSS